MKKLIGILLSTGVAFCANAAVPQEVRNMVDGGAFAAVEKLLSENPGTITAVEADSLRAIMHRVRGDFENTYEEGVALIQKKFPHTTREMIDAWAKKKYIEVRNIDGVDRVFNKTVSNLDRLVPELSKHRKAEAYAGFRELEEAALKAINVSSDKGLSLPVKVTLRFSATVKPDAVPAGSVVRAWLPFPVESERQSDATLISSSDKATFSQGSVHNTVYMEKKAVKGKETRFEIVVSYKTRSQYYSKDYIAAHKSDYDKNSEFYKKYTSAEYPHIVVNDQMRQLAKSIVGNETDPLRQASLIYEWEDTYFPWAGAREYSTIPCIPQYVLEMGHGDCGQVSLLYISLLRSLGIPARWESGYMLEEHSAGMHDWAEVYYEGIGWVPVDMSFGLLKSNREEAVMDFYKTGLDYMRFASNKGVGGILSPAKKWVRSETVDFQLGEVEWDGGNLFYYEDWQPKVEMISIER